MPIEIRDHNGRNLPTIICDACGKPITTTDGLICWPLDRPSDVVFTHLEPCSDSDAYPFSQMIRTLPQALAFGLGMVDTPWPQDA